MAFDVSYIYRIVDQFSAPARRMARTARDLKRATDQLNASMKKTATGLRQAGSASAEFVRRTAPIVHAARTASKGVEQMGTSMRRSAKETGRAAAAVDQMKRSLVAMNNVAVKVPNMPRPVAPRPAAAGMNMADIGRNIEGFGMRGMAMVTAPAYMASKSLLTAAASAEQAEKAFQSMAGSAQVGSEVFQFAMDHAKRTPYSPEQVLKATQTLMAFGQTADQVKKNILTLGDVAATTTDKDLAGMALVLGQVTSAGRLMGQDALQLTTRGVALYAELAKMTGKTQAELRKMGEMGLIPAAAVVKVLEQMTKEGGRAFKGVENMADTLGGIGEQIGGAWYDARIQLGQLLVDLFDLKTVGKDMIVWLSDMVEGVRRFTSENPKLTKFIFIATGIAAVMAPLALVMGVVVTAMGSLATIAGAVGASTLLLGAGIAGLAAWFATMYLKTGDATSALKGMARQFGEMTGAEKFADTLERLVDLMDALINKPEQLSAAWKRLFGSIEWRDLIDITWDKEKAFPGMFGKGGAAGSGSDWLNRLALGTTPQYRALMASMPQFPLAATGASMPEYDLLRSLNGGALGMAPFEVTADVNVTVNGTPGTVKSVEAKSSGNTKLNVGQNMK